MFKALKLSLIGLTLLGTLAKADHELPQGSLNRLLQDTRNLHYAVSYSSLNSSVKRSVYYFRYDVENLIRCAQIPDRTNTQGSRDHDLLPEHCEHYLHNVHYSWYQVDRYLWDTAWDYPYVYNYYLRVRQDMRDLPH